MIQLFGTFFTIKPYLTSFRCPSQTVESHKNETIKMPLFDFTRSFSSKH